MLNIRPAHAPWFHLRPLCAAACGALFGVLAVSLLPPPEAYLGALVPLAGAAYGALRERRGWFLLFLFAGLGLVYGGIRYPADGGFALSGPVVTLPPGKGADALIQARAAVQQRIALLFPENTGVAAGMLLGDKSDVGESVMEAFSRAGVLHLLAVSGLHVSVLAGAFSLLFRRSPWVRFFATALFLCGYAALTGFSPSVLRAGVMLLTVLLAVPLGRRPDGPGALALAFLFVLAADPFALYRAGFQLSFTAVYGLLLLREPLGRPLRRLGSLAAGLLSGSLAVVISTAPAMALAFRRWSLLSLLTNVIVLPLAPLFLVPGFAAVCLSFLSPAAAAVAAAPARLALNAIVEVAMLSGGWEVPVPGPGGASYLLFLAALPFFSGYCLREPAARRLAGTALLAGSLLLWLAGL